MTTLARRCFKLCPRHASTGRTMLAMDKTIKLEINDSTQQIRICAERDGLPPILIVQAGPGFPLLHEVAKFQRCLNLEKDFFLI